MAQKEENFMEMCETDAQRRKMLQWLPLYYCFTYVEESMGQHVYAYWAHSRLLSIQAFALDESVPMILRYTLS